MTLSEFFRSPALCTDRIVGRIRRRLATIPAGPVVKTINKSVSFEHSALPFLDEDDFRAMLTGTYELQLCDLLKRRLEPGDIFLDVGANVGYISATAASRVHPGGEVHGFEPLPECFARLERLRELNPGHRLFFNNVALGREEGSLPIGYNPAGDSRNASLVPGKVAAMVRNVQVRRLDEYIRSAIADPARIRLIKIDVEGFEYNVLSGLLGFFAETSNRPVIVCEIKPWELPRLGASAHDFDQMMTSQGYRSYSLSHERKPVCVADLNDLDVLIFQPEAAG